MNLEYNGIKIDKVICRKCYDTQMRNGKVVYANFDYFYNGMISGDTICGDLLKGKCPYILEHLLK